MSDQAPLPIGHPNGRGRDDATGKFLPGNKAAVGHANPRAAENGRYRQKFLATLRDADIELAVRTIRGVMSGKGSKPGDRLAAARELLDRVLGRPAGEDVLARIDRLETALARAEREREAT